MQPSSSPTPITSVHDVNQNQQEGYRGVIASSIELVHSYSRSQSFINENLPSSFNHSSFSTSYQNNQLQADVESQWEADEENEENEENESLGLSHEAYSSDEGPDLSSIDGDQPEVQPLLEPSTPKARPIRHSASHNPQTLRGGLQDFWKRSGLLSSSASIQQYNTLSDSSVDQPAVLTDSPSVKPFRPHPKRPTTNETQAPFSSSSHESTYQNQVGLENPSQAVTGTSTFGQTLFNSFNVLCGVGLLSEPLAFSSAVTNYTAKILARMMMEDKTLLTYNDICCKAFGRSMQYPIAGLFCLELFSLSVALMVIFGDSMSTIFSNYSPTIFKLIAFLLVIPTIFMPFKILSYTSLIGLCSSLTLVIVVIIDGFLKSDSPGSIFSPAQTSLWPNSKWGLSAGLMMSGFSGHSVIPSLARDMRNPQDFNRMIDYAYLSAGSMYAIIGVVGYLMFGDSVSQEITHDILVTPGFPIFINQLAIWMVAINPIAKFALSTRPLNYTIEHLLSLETGEMDDSHSIQSQPPSSSVHQVDEHQTVSRSQDSKGPVPKAKNVKLTKAFGRILSRIIVTALVVAVSIIIPDFDRVMSFLGAFAAFVICIVIPVSAELLLNKTLIHQPILISLNSILLIISILMALIGTFYSIFT
ncbi:transmembrane amino acid transporter protein-domain-containing protein [Melampsora americana]|nr:transmembrane amino acid transporter protein-domain-containing protein [Melampsora americana]